jgi:hypothetical protein
MRSPFPGMDPYIEACELWEDFHQKLIGEIEQALANSVPDNYSVRLGERSYVVLTTTDKKNQPREYRAQADVAITRRADDRATAGAQQTAVLVEEEEAEESVSMRALVAEEHRESFIEIRQLHAERRLVTTIEILSPSNKRPSTLGREQYWRKRQAHLEGMANFVEIDLLRGGTRMPMEDQWPASPYYLLVSRREKAPQCTVWPVQSVRPLPKISVPLEQPDPDVPLELQPMIEAIYQRSRYEHDIDYSQPCQPPLSPAEAAWLEQRLKQLHGET